MAKQAKMVVDKAFPFPRSTKEFMVPLLNMQEELYDGIYQLGTSTFNADGFRKGCH